MHRPEDLLDMVADVERYPKFITLISAVRIKNPTSPSQNVSVFDAEATVSYKFLSENFLSNVTVDRNLRTIKVKKSGHGGAVKDLENSWVFHQLSDGSTVVDFYVNVKLKGLALEMLLRDKFDKAGKHILKLFEHKASLAFDEIGDPDLDWEAELD